MVGAGESGPPHDDYPDFNLVLHAALSNAADRPDRLTLSNLRLDRYALNRHAPQLRHLTLHRCVCDPEEVARVCGLESLKLEPAPEPGGGGDPLPYVDML